jgi:hypothetical protein
VNEPIYKFNKDRPFDDEMSDFEAQCVFNGMDNWQLLVVVGAYLFAATKPDGKFTEEQLNNELVGISAHALTLKCFAWVDQIVDKKRINLRSN